MSMILMVKAMSIKVGNPLRKLVLIKLADNANDQGECWPSFQHIADQCEISRRSVIVHIEELQKQGFLKIYSRKGPKGNSSNLYILLLGSAGDSLVGGAGDSLPLVQELHPEPVTLEPLKDLLVTDKSETSGKLKKFNFTDGQFRCAKAMYEKILEVVPKEKKPNFEKWANDIRLATKALKISTNDFYKVFLWANADEFWRVNIRSPEKLRKQYPVLEVKSREEHKPTYSTAKKQAPQTETAGDRARAMLRKQGIDI